MAVLSGVHEIPVVLKAFDAGDVRGEGFLEKQVGFWREARHCGRRRRVFGRILLQGGRRNEHEEEKPLDRPIK